MVNLFERVSIDALKTTYELIIGLEMGRDFLANPNARQRKIKAITRFLENHFETECLVYSSLE